MLDRYREENATLADVMKPFEHVVESGTPLPAAVALMNEKGMRYVPVVRDGRLAGLMTKGSIVRHLPEVYIPTEDESGPRSGQGGGRMNGGAGACLAFLAERQGDIIQAIQEHLILSFVSVLLGAALAIPPGVLAARRPRLARSSWRQPM